MHSKLKKAQNLRQVLLLITAQALAIASMIWGGSLSVDAQERPGLPEQVMLSTSSCEDAQPQAKASSKNAVSLLDFSIGKPWG